MDPVFYILAYTGYIFIDRRLQDKETDRLNRISEEQRHQAEEIHRHLAEYPLYFFLLQDFSKEMTIEQPLARCSATVERSIQDLIPEYGHILRQSWREEIDSQCRENITKTFNALKVSLLLEPDLPALLGYNDEADVLSISDDIFDFTPPTTFDEVPEFTETEVEHVINYSIRKDFFSEFKAGMESILKELCKHHIAYHQGLQERLKLVTDLDALTDLAAVSETDSADKPTQDYIEKLGDNYLQLKDAEHHFDEALASFFGDILVEEKIEALTVAPNAPLPIRIAKYIGSLSYDLTKAWATVGLMHVWLGYHAIRGIVNLFTRDADHLKSNLEDFDKILLADKPLFQQLYPTSKDLQSGFKKDQRITIALMFNLYKVICLKNVLGHRRTQVNAETKELAAVIGFTPETNDELNWRYKALYNAIRPRRLEWGYKAAIKAMVNHQFPTPEQLKGLAHFDKTPVERTVEALMSRLETDRYKERILQTQKLAEESKTNIGTLAERILQTQKLAEESKTNMGALAKEIVAIKEYLRTTASDSTEETAREYETYAQNVDDALNGKDVTEKAKKQQERLKQKAGLFNSRY